MTATTRARGPTRGRMKRDTPQIAHRNAAEQQYPLQCAHGAEQHGAGDPHETEERRCRGGRAHTGLLPTRKEVVPRPGPRGQRRQLADQGQCPEQELAGAQHDDERRHQDGQGALTSGAERSRAHPAAEPVAPGATAQVVQVVEVGVLAEGQTDAAGQLGHFVALARRAPGRRWRRWPLRVLGARGG